MQCCSQERRQNGKIIFVISTAKQIKLLITKKKNLKEDSKE